MTARQLQHELFAYLSTDVDPYDFSHLIQTWGEQSVWSIPHEATTEDLDAEQLSAWISTAPEPQRSALAFFYLNEFSHREMQNLLDVKLTRARNILANLVGRGVLVKISDHERGPGVEYGPGPTFPAPKPRRHGGPLKRGAK